MTYATKADDVWFNNQELRQFARHVARKFFETMRSNDKVGMELFFWKSVKDAVEITEGYGSYR